MCKDLQQTIQSHGLYAAAGDQPANDILGNVDNTRLERGIRSMDGNGNLPSMKSGIVLHTGQRVTVPGVELHAASEICERFDEQTLLIVGFNGSDDQLNPKHCSTGRKLATLGIVGTTGMLVGWASSIDS